MAGHKIKQKAEGKTREQSKIKVNSRLENILETIGAAASTLRDLPQDVNNCCKDIPVSVSQKRRRFDVVHFRNFVMQLNESDLWLTRSNCVQAVFDQGTGV